MWPSCDWCPLVEIGDSLAYKVWPPYEHFKENINFVKCQQSHVVSPDIYMGMLSSIDRKLAYERGVLASEVNRVCESIQESIFDGK